MGKHSNRVRACWILSIHSEAPAKFSQQKEGKGKQFTFGCVAAHKRFPSRWNKNITRAHKISSLDPLTRAASPAEQKKVYYKLSSSASFFSSMRQKSIWARAIKMLWKLKNLFAREREEANRHPPLSGSSCSRRSGSWYFIARAAWNPFVDARSFPVSYSNLTSAERSARTSARHLHTFLLLINGPERKECVLGKFGGPPARPCHVKYAPSFFRRFMARISEKFWMKFSMSRSKKKHGCVESGFPCLLTCMFIYQTESIICYWEGRCEAAARVTASRAMLLAHATQKPQENVHWNVVGNRCVRHAKCFDTWIWKGSNKIYVKYGRVSMRGMWESLCWSSAPSKIMHWLFLLSESQLRKCLMQIHFHILCSI